MRRTWHGARIFLSGSVGDIVCMRREECCCKARRGWCCRPQLFEVSKSPGLVRSRVIEGRWSPEQLEDRILLERSDLSVSDAIPAAQRERKHQRAAVRYFPKLRDLDAVTDAEVRMAYDGLNRSPNKRLEWWMPYEVYHSVGLRLL